MERAAALADRLGGSGIPLDQLDGALLEADIVITSTASPDALLSAADVRDVMKRRRSRPLFFIDPSVPRDIDPEVRNIDNVFLFDIDDLQQVVESNRQDREREIAKVQLIIEDELRDCLHRSNALGAGPLIRDLRQQAAQLQETELARWQAKLAHLSDDDRKLVGGVLRGYGNKLLHEPLVQIREFANAEGGFLRLDTVRRLFGLGGETAEKGDEK